MGKVNVIIVDATGNKEQKVGLPDDIKCGIIMVKLVEKIKLPSVGPDGNPISYKFIHKVTGRQLLESQTLGEAGIKDGDVLRLQPEITAGANCSSCGEPLQEGVLFCCKCGAAAPQQTAPEQPAAPVDPATPAVPFTPAAPVFTPVQPILNAKKTNDIANKIQKKIKDGILFHIVGALSGIVSVICGIIAATFSDGYWEGNSSYGGDAYTGIQNAAAQTANNVQDLAEIMKFGVSAFLIIFGIALICFFGAKFISKLTEKDD